MLMIHGYFFSLSCSVSIIGPGHAKTCLIPYANNKGADQPAHPRSLINTFVVRCFDSMICILAIYEVLRFYLGSVADQVGLTWSKTPEDTFLHDVAFKSSVLSKMLIKIRKYAQTLRILRIDCILCK